MVKDVDGLQTSSKRSQKRPGVAIKMSAPRLRTLRCFWADIPPTIAATLTSGDPFDLAVSADLPLVAFEGLPRGASSASDEDGGVRQAFKWDDTCSASSRVGVRTSAETCRFSRRGCVCISSSSLDKIGSPYARVFPEPCTRVNIVHHRSFRQTNSFCNPYDIPTVSGRW
jgi:hypothetical protein